MSEKRKFYPQKNRRSVSAVCRTMTAVLAAASLVSGCDAKDKYVNKNSTSTAFVIRASGLEVPSVDPHAQALNGLLGWNVFPFIDGTGDRLELINNVAGKQIIFFLGHSFTPQAFQGVKLSDGNFVTPADLPQPLNYQLVFISACSSARSADPGFAFRTVFDSDQNKNYAYIGWDKTVTFAKAADVGCRFFLACDGSRNVGKALDIAFTQSNAPDPNGANVVLSGNGNFTIDKTP